MVVLHQIGNLEVFVGNQIARFDQRTCSLGCEVFTLPGNPQIAFGKPLNGSPAVLGPLDFAGDAPMQAFQLALLLCADSGG